MRATVSDFPGNSTMTVSVDGPDAGGDPNVDPFIFEAPMTHLGGDRYEFRLNTPVNLDGSAARPHRRRSRLVVTLVVEQVGEDVGSLAPLAG